MQTKEGMKTTGQTGEDTESRIARAATRLFIQKGYVETSMSDIAAEAGINRPTLNYYFRTKDRLFENMLQRIMLKIAPKVTEAVSRRELTVEERVRLLVDTYFDFFSVYPTLPVFIMRESSRDVQLFIRTIEQIGMKERLGAVKAGIEKEMAEGKLRRVPVVYLFYTLYSQLFFPFSTKVLCSELLHQQEEDFKEMLEEWKEYVVRSVTQLLQP